MKKTRFLTYIISSILTIIFIFLFHNNTKLFNHIIEKRESDKSYNFIAHAGGSINGLIFTNSKQALDKSIKKNFKMIELDLYISEDSKIFAFHDFKRLNKACNLKRKVKEEFYSKDLLFCKKKYYERYEMLSDTDINQIFLSNKDLILFTDKTQNFSILKQKLKFNDRIVVEIFSIRKFLLSKFYNIKNPMFNFRGSKVHKLFIYLFRPKFISVNVEDVKKHKKFLQKIYDKNISLIYAYTSNDKIFNQEYINRYIHGVYTDNLN
ncbi:hypothetical protein HIMB5_00004100 [alpha proteobacterium HIMB5]|nr:hypothetical protein HIMB5_00004100 [alpha proteobacterium HIMB5]